LEIFISLFFLSHDSVLLGNAVFSDNVYLVSLLLGFSVLDLYFFKKFVGLFCSILQFDIFSFKINLKDFNTFRGFLEFVKTVDNVSFFNINSIILGLVDLFVQLNERKITLWSNVNVSSHLLEIDGTDVVDEVMDFTHVSFEAIFNLRGCIHFEIVKIVMGYSNQCIFRPW